MSNGNSYGNNGGSCSVTAGSGQFLNPVDVRDAMPPGIFRLLGPVR